MKSKVLALVAVGALYSAVSLAQIGVSISIGQPGFYGQLDIGDYPRPALIYAKPVVIERGPAYVAEPIYLHVPRAHARNWRHYCSRYSACGRPVYFVQDNWYNKVYVPKYRERHVERPVQERAERRDDRHDDRDNPGQR
ncbi:MAG: hypothetical protein QM718_15165 [Steroidobacteraceae bacterium]